MATYHTDIDEISGELNTETNRPEYESQGWPMTAEITCGDYRIREYRSDRNHLGIEVSGPDREKTRTTAQALFDLYWAD